MLRKVFILFTVLLVTTFVSAQEVKVRGTFLADSAKIGELIPYSLTARYSKKADVLFPDSTFSYAPFEFRSKKFFTTETKDSVSYDSVVYYLASYEVQPVQQLSLPVFVIHPQDCTRSLSNMDTLRMIQTIKALPDSINLRSLPLKMNTAYQSVKWVFNYTLLILLGAILIVAIAIFFTLFWDRILNYYKLKRLQKNHQVFLNRFDELIGQLQSNLTARLAEDTLSVWKKYMEELSKVPYTKYTTREIRQAFAGNEVPSSLVAIDRMVYGGIRMESLTPFENLKLESQALFEKKKEQLGSNEKEPTLQTNSTLTSSTKGEMAPQQLTLTDIESYANLLRELPCPICQRTDQKLNGTIIHTVKSFIVITSSRKKPLIGCPTCLTKKNTIAIASTALLGWWGFPWGLIKTPQFIYLNIKEREKIKSERPNDVMLSFTLNHLQEIEANKDNPEKLKEIIKSKKSWWQS